MAILPVSLSSKLASACGFRSYVCSTIFACALLIATLVAIATPTYSQPADACSSSDCGGTWVLSACDVVLPSPYNCTVHVWYYYRWCNNGSIQISGDISYAVPTSCTYINNLIASSSAAVGQVQTAIYDGLMKCLFMSLYNSAKADDDEHGTHNAEKFECAQGRPTIEESAYAVSCQAFCIFDFSPAQTINGVAYAHYVTWAPCGQAVCCRITKNICIVPGINGSPGVLTVVSTSLVTTNDPCEGSAGDCVVNPVVPGPMTANYETPCQFNCFGYIP